ncbi:MAG: GGDEF domain-containing protein [Calditrichaeota bacterium]|nr:MAG: GGDEF domain-containing protein [Calditrichota bacterium]
MLRSLSFDPQPELKINLLIYHTLTFFIPLNIIFMAFLRERGILTFRGIGRLGLISVQPFFLYTLLHNRYLDAFYLLDTEIISSSFLDSIPIPQFSLLLYLFGVIALVINYIYKKEIIEGAFFWALLCTFLAFLPGDSSSQSSFYLTTAGFILLISVLEYSHNLAFRDELTGLPTRRALNEYFLKLPSRYSIAMADIDKFKKFNDDYGHDVGDQALRMVASQLMKVNGGGKAFRYGGEEFTIVFPGKTAGETKTHMEILRKQIASTPFYIRSPKRPVRKPEKLDMAPRSGSRVPINISIGVAERDETHSEPDRVLKAADRALLRAKRTGRNKVIIFGKVHARS